MSINNKMTSYSFLILILVLSIFITSCGPKDNSDKTQVKMEDVFEEISGDLSNNDHSSHDHSTHDHSSHENTAQVYNKKLLVKEILTTDKYTYLSGESESGEDYWVAIAKQDFNIGDKIAFDDGLMKKNFESKEFNRIFETIYLVSKFQRLVKVSGTENGAITPGKSIEQNTSTNKKTGSKIEPELSVDGTVSLASLFAQTENYKDKEIAVSGQVLKVNYNIMGKNWVHISSSPVNPDLDLTITTNERVMEGEKVRFKGFIRLDKDFGAGYKYAVIMEDAIKE